MTTITDEQFLHVVYDWMCSNVEAISAEWPQNGGWEGWAQGEIIRAVHASYPTAMALREQPVYLVPREKVDLQINDPDSAIRDTILCELKCQSYFNASNFANGLREDVYALDHNIAPPFGLAHRVSVGFYFTQHFSIPPGFQWNSQSDPTGEIGMCYLQIS